MDNQLRGFLLATFFVVAGSTGQAQSSSANQLSFGIEQDILPYITGGYFAGAWVGKKHARIRGVLAHVNKPDWLLNEGFTNNSVTAYAFLADYFLEEKWKGWWIATGLVYWKSKIQSNEKRSTAAFKNVLLNGSIGYHWKLYKNIYIGPWAGMHIRVGGDQRVPVDSREFRPALLNPEASLKVGWYLR